MSLENYFAKMPDSRTKPKKKTPAGKNASNAAMAEPEEASDAEAPADTETTKSGVDQNILLALSQITDNITKSFDAKVDTVLAAIHDQTSQVQALGARVEEAETRISTVEDTMQNLHAKVRKLETQISEMADHMDDLENRNRRCNIRLINLPEGMEGRDPVTFLEKWLPSYLKLTTKAGRIKLDRAHRSLAPRRSGPQQRPRPIIMKVHNFTDKQRMMAAARRLSAEPNQPADQLHVSLFNDYSAAVVRRRKAFDAVKNRLRGKKIPYALLYPATLKVTVNDVEKKFDSPEAAAAYVDSLP